MAFLVATNATLKNMKHNTIIHIPKTAGSSAVEATKHNVYGHDTLSQHLAKKQDLGYVWSIVRNPYDRALSLYYFMRSRILRIVPKEKHNMNTFSLAENPNDFWCNHVKDIELASFYMRPQSWFLSEDYIPLTKPQSVTQIRDSIPEPQSISLSSKVDQILRFERLQDDWQILKANIDCGDLPYINKTDIRPSLHWSEELNADSKAKIAEMYADDFELLQYQK